MKSIRLVTGSLMGLVLLAGLALAANADVSGSVLNASGLQSEAELVVFQPEAAGEELNGRGGGGKPPKNPTATPGPTAAPQGCLTCPPMFVRSIVVGANENPSGSTYATCRVVMFDEAGNQLEGINVLHEWSGSASGTEVDVTSPHPPYATSTWITVDNGPKCKGKNPSQIYTCTVLDAWSSDYTYEPASNWETSDSDDACSL